MVNVSTPEQHVADSGRNFLFSFAMQSSEPGGHNR